MTLYDVKDTFGIYKRKNIKNFYYTVLNGKVHVSNLYYIPSIINIIINNGGRKITKHDEMYEIDKTNLLNKYLSPLKRLLYGLPNE